MSRLEVLFWGIFAPISIMIWGFVIVLVIAIWSAIKEYREESKNYKDRGRNRYE